MGPASSATSSALLDRQLPVRTVDRETFLILPHESVLTMYRQKGSDYDRWLRGMRRYQSSLLEHA